jgi:uncharacterized cupredoxin-like copper-binding protein
MQRILSSLAAGALAVTLLAVPARAETGQAVKIALLDMSSLATWPMGPGSAAGPGFGGGPGLGMMRPGQGFGGPGFGMMGPGQGFGGPGFGMMGPGMMGSAGGGMMGMMSIRADETSVKAGEVTFDVANWSRSIIHELVVIAVDGPDAPLPYDFTKQVVPEDQVKMLGETEELEPNASGSLALNLTPGNYLLVCNIPGHYAAGMALAFTVTE